MEAGDETLAPRYESALYSGELLSYLSTWNPPGAAQPVRKDRTIRPPDAIQLACASHARVDLFITNEQRLSAKSIRQILFDSSLRFAHARECDHRIHCQLTRS